MLLKQRCLLVIFFFMFSSIYVGSTQAAIDPFEFETIEEQQRFKTLTHELRCPKCQNQSIGDSNAPIAQDLRHEVYRLMTEEKADDQQVIDFMLARYGEFVLYTPKLETKTILLWFGPFILLLIGGLVLIRVLKNHRRLSPAEASVKLSELSAEQQQKLKQIMDDKES